MAEPAAASCLVVAAFPAFSPVQAALAGPVVESLFVAVVRPTVSAVVPASVGVVAQLYVVVALHSVVVALPFEVVGLPFCYFERV